MTHCSSNKFHLTCFAHPTAKPNHYSQFLKEDDMKQRHFEEKIPQMLTKKTKVPVKTEDLLISFQVQYQIQCCIFTPDQLSLPNNQKPVGRHTN